MLPLTTSLAPNGVNLINEYSARCIVASLESTEGRGREERGRKDERSMYEWSEAEVGQGGKKRFKGRSMKEEKRGGAEEEDDRGTVT